MPCGVQTLPQLIKFGMVWEDVWVVPATWFNVRAVSTLGLTAGGLNRFPVPRSVPKHQSASGASHRQLFSVLDILLPQKLPQITPWVDFWANFFCPGADLLSESRNHAFASSLFLIKIATLPVAQTCPGGSTRRSSRVHSPNGDPGKQPSLTFTGCLPKRSANCGGGQGSIRIHPANSWHPRF